jgi:hypothetical protein
MAFLRNPVVYVPDLTNGRPIVDGKVYVLVAGTVPPTHDSDIDPLTLVQVTYENEAGNIVNAPQPLYTSKGGCLYGEFPSSARQYISAQNSFVFAVYNSVGMLQYSSETSGGDYVETADLAASNSTVLVGGVEAELLPASVSDIKSLESIQKIPEKKYAVTGYHVGSDVGGGTFIWNPARAWSSHNGGTILALGAFSVYDGTTSTVSAFLSWSGSGSGCFERILPSRELHPEFFGAPYNDPTFNSYNCLMAQHNTLLEGDTFKGAGKYYLSQRFTFTKRFVTVDVAGYLLPMDGYTDFVFATNYDSSASVSGQIRGDVAGVTDFKQLNIDCRFVSRGAYLYRIDCTGLDKIAVYRAYGTAIWLNRFRETSLFAPRVVSCMRRLRFDNPSPYNIATAYSVGDRVRITPAAYSAGTTYNLRSECLFGGNRYVSMAASNTGNSPDTSPLLWKKMPFIDYECLIANTGFDPEAGFNSNNSTTANRYWKRVYQDEAVCEIVDEGLQNIDRANQVILHAPDFRDWNNLCGVRIDNCKSSAPLTHIKITDGHIHALQIEVINAYSSRPGQIVPTDIPPMQRVIEVGLAQNVFVFSNLRLPNSDDSFIALIGDGSLKRCVSVHIGGVASGSGNNICGVFVGSSALKSRSDLDLRSIWEGAGVTTLFDPDGFFSLQRQTEISTSRLAGFDGTPVGYRATFDTSYNQSYAYAAFKDGDDYPRVVVDLGATSGGVSFGSGADPVDIRLSRVSTNVLGLATGDSFRLSGGGWDTGNMQFGVYRLWVDASGKLRIKNGEPTSDTDGVIVGTQS